MSRRHSRLPDFVRLLLRWRWLVVFVFLVFAVVVGSGGRHLGFIGDYRVFFSDDNPLLLAFEELQSAYTKDDNVLFVLAPRNGDVFTRETLAAVEELTEASWQIPFSTRVDSITNFQHTETYEDDLVVDDLVLGAADLSADDLARIRAAALSEERLVNRLVSPTGHVTAVNVQVQHEAEDPGPLLTAVAYCRDLADQIRADHPDIDVYLTGTVMLHHAFVEATQQDMSTLVPLMYLGIIVFLYLFFRSLIATLATVVIIALSTATAMGAAGWLGIGLTPVSAVAPTLIMTLAVADCVHILMTLIAEMRQGREKKAAIVEAVRVNVQPVLITSVTTAIGFLSMNSSDVPPLHDLGNVTAIGIGAAFVGSVILLPALIAILPLRVRPVPASGPALSNKLAEFVISRRRPLMWLSLATVVVVVAFVPANELDENTVHYFDERVPFRKDTDFVLENLSGLHQVEYSLATAEPGGISEPEYLQKLDEFAAWWREQPEVVHVSTLSDTMRRLNRVMHGDDPAWDRLPESRELAAQYLLLYELSLPYGLDLNHQINTDRSATRFSVTLGDASSQKIIDLETRGNAWLEDNAPEAMRVAGVGPSIMFSHLTIRNIKSMVLGTVTALLLISALLVFALKSLRFGVLSLIPNLVPAALGFGLWGLLVGKVGFLLSVVLAMTLGIVVDDSVHFLSKYLRACRERGLGAEDAVRHAFGAVGPALIATSAVLIGGFAILSMSSFAQNAEMGLLTAMIIGLALLADFLLLPPLLLWFDRRRAPAREVAEPKRDVVSVTG